MTSKLITDHLKNKGFTIVYSGKENVIAAFNTTNHMVVSWVMTTDLKGKHVVVIAFESTRDVRFNGKISNLQQFNSILDAVI